MKLSPAQKLLLEDNPELIAEYIPDVKDGETGPKGDTGERGEKGDKGDTGEKGDRGEVGPAGKDGKDGVDGKNGRNGVDGIDGRDGRDGKDGSPDTAEDIKEKLSTLKEVLEVSQVKDAVSKKEVIEISSGMKKIDGRIKLIDQRWGAHGGGSSLSSMSDKTVTVGEIITTFPITITYNGNNQVISVARTGGTTKNLTYNGDGTIHTVNDGTRTETMGYTSNLLTSISIT